MWERNDLFPTATGNTDRYCYRNAVSGVHFDSDAHGNCNCYRRCHGHAHSDGNLCSSDEYSDVDANGGAE